MMKNKLKSYTTDLFIFIYIFIIQAKSRVIHPTSLYISDFFIYVKLKGSVKKTVVLCLTDNNKLSIAVPVVSGKSRLHPGKNQRI